MAKRIRQPINPGGGPAEFPRVPTQEELDAYREELRERQSAALGKIQGTEPGATFGMPGGVPEGTELAEPEQLPWGAEMRPATVEREDKVKRFSNIPQYAGDPSVTYIKEAPEPKIDPLSSEGFNIFRSHLIENIGFDPTTYNPYQVALSAVNNDPDTDPERFKTVYNNAKMKRDSGLEIYNYAVAQFEKKEKERLALEKERGTKQKEEKKEAATKAEADKKRVIALNDKNQKLLGDIATLTTDLEIEDPGTELYKIRTKQIKLMNDQIKMNEAEYNALTKPKATGEGSPKRAPFKTKEEVVSSLKREEISPEEARKWIAILDPALAKKVGMKAPEFTPSGPGTAMAGELPSTAKAKPAAQPAAKPAPPAQAKPTPSADIDIGPFKLKEAKKFKGLADKVGLGAKNWKALATGIADVAGFTFEELSAKPGREIDRIIRENLSKAIERIKRDFSLEERKSASVQGFRAKPPGIS